MRKHRGLLALLGQTRMNNDLSEQSRKKAVQSGIAVARCEAQASVIQAALTIDTARLDLSTKVAILPQRSQGGFSNVESVLLRLLGIVLFFSGRRCCDLLRRNERRDDQLHRNAKHQHPGFIDFSRYRMRK
jgi:hypothetical protein